MSGAPVFTSGRARPRATQRGQMRAHFYLVGTRRFKDYYTIK